MTVSHSSISNGARRRATALTWTQRVIYPLHHGTNHGWSMRSACLTVV